MKNDYLKRQDKLTKATMNYIGFFLFGWIGFIVSGYMYVANQHDSEQIKYSLNRAKSSVEEQKKTIKSQIQIISSMQRKIVAQNKIISDQSEKIDRIENNLSELNNASRSLIHLGHSGILSRSEILDTLSIIVIGQRYIQENSNNNSELISKLIRQLRSKSDTISEEIKRVGQRKLVELEKRRDEIDSVLTDLNHKNHAIDDNKNFEDDKTTTLEWKEQGDKNNSYDSPNLDPLNNIEQQHYQPTDFSTNISTTNEDKSTKPEAQDKPTMSPTNIQYTGTTPVNIHLRRQPEGLTLRKDESNSSLGPMIKDFYLK